MNKIYLPVDNVNDFKCYSVQNDYTIRAYSQVPQLNTTSNYVDFYINSHYLEKEGTQTWGNYVQYLPSCISSESITNDFYYRNDFPDILFMFCVFVFFGFYLPFKIIRRFYKK